MLSYVYTSPNSYESFCVVTVIPADQKKSVCFLQILTTSNETKILIPMKCTHILCIEVGKASRTCVLDSVALSWKLHDEEYEKIFSGC